MEDINIAMLIDADNVSARYISGILSELSKYGKITMRRMYGDWSQDRLHSWLGCASRYSLTPVMQPNNTPGKNASDIGLIIDAMDILYTGDVQGFCIVSSDGDFNKLATRLREAGKVVIGMGEKKTPESFRVSCERFIFLDILENEEGSLTAVRKNRSRRKAVAGGTGAAGGSAGGASGASASASGSGAGSAAGSGAGSAGVSGSASSASGSSASGSPGSSYASAAAAYASAASAALASALRDSGRDLSSDMEEADGLTSPEDIESAIIKMISDNNAEGKETGLGEIGSRLVKIFPDFDIRNYHYSKLSEFLKDLPSLSVENRDSAVWVSLKSSPDAEVERQIRQIFNQKSTDSMYISILKRELEAVNPNLEATIQKSGVTRFSVYLNRMIPSVEVSGRYVSLKRG